MPAVVLWSNAGLQVVLVANSLPAINDITAAELRSVSLAFTSLAAGLLLALNVQRIDRTALLSSAQLSDSKQLAGGFVC